MIELALYYEILTFVVIIYSLRMLGFIIGHRIFSKFPDKGYAISGTLCLLVVSYISWNLSAVLKIPFSPLQVLFILLIIALGILFLSATKRLNLKELKFDRKLFYTEEILFISAFVLFLIYRAILPEINVIEDIMDFGIINALIKGTNIPPTDVWYAGSHVNYYYFGHFSVALIGKISEINQAVLYNLYIAYLFATVLISAFSLSNTILKNSFFSFFSATLLTLGGNLSYLHHKIFNSQTSYFYADARSLIPNTINEFPAYSFIISNLHAHIIDLQFVMLFLAFLLATLLDKQILKSKMYIILAAISLGSMLATNTWDFVIYSPFLILAIILSGVDWRNGLSSIKNNLKYILIGFGIILSSVLFYLPFILSFHNPTSGVGIVREPTDIIAILIMFGYFFFIVIVFLFYFKQTPKKRIIGLFAIYGLFLIAVPTAIYLKDIYYQLNPPYYRANTVFKVWYQAWVILSIISGPISYQIYRNIKEWKHKFLNFQLLVGFIFLSFFVFAYPYISYKYRIGNKEPMWIDGSAYLEESDPGKKFIIDWLNESVDGQVTIVEGYGKSYSLESIVSAYTGHPTIVGWYEHELGWRNNWPEIANRMGEVEKIYTSQNTTEIKSILDKYNVKYIIISNKERELFGQNAGQNLLSISQVIASYDEDMILLVN